MEGAGDVAFVKETTPRDFSLGGAKAKAWATKAAADLRLLCPAGGCATVDMYDSCNLARVPAYAYVGTPAFRASEVGACMGPRRGRDGGWAGGWAGRLTRWWGGERAPPGLSNPPLARPCSAGRPGRCGGARGRHPGPWLRGSRDRRRPAYRRHQGADGGRV